MELNKEAYSEWRSDPGTKLFLKFLEDYRQRRMEQWADLQTQYLEKACPWALEARFCRYLSEIDFEAIEKFYEESK